MAGDPTEIRVNTSPLQVLKHYNTADVFGVDINYIGNQKEM